MRTLGFLHEGAWADGAGNFAFRERLDKGWYELVVDSDRYEGQSSFALGRTRVDIQLVARRRSPSPP